MSRRWLGRMLLALAAVIASRGAASAHEGPRVDAAAPVAQFEAAIKSGRYSPVPVVFEQLPEHTPSAIQFELINGQEADRRHFPTVFSIKVGWRPCTAQLVGAAALLTAAHCVPDKSEVMIRLDRDVRAVCEHATGYANDPAEDWALCLLSLPVVGIHYETIAETVPEGGQQVVLAGYGCTKEGGSPSGTLLVGKSKTVDRDATSVSDGKEVLPLTPRGSTVYTKSRISAGEAVLCPGDSGGPLFIFASNSYADARRLIGVNAATTYDFGVSIFAATGSPAARTFFKDWADRKGQAVCGVNTAEPCR